MIKEQADKNQAIYRDIFGIYPDNKIRNYKDLDKIKKRADITKYPNDKDLIKGHAVAFQTEFLKDEYLGLKATSKEYFVPSINFT